MAAALGKDCVEPLGFLTQFCETQKIPCYQPLQNDFVRVVATRNMFIQKYVGDCRELPRAPSEEALVKILEKVGLTEEERKKPMLCSFHASSLLASFLN